ncbi:protein-L-isoaspartate O-methyltransferase [Sarocladium strictum]
MNNIDTNAIPRKVDRIHYAPQHAYCHSQEPIGFWAVVNLPYLDALALETTVDYLVPTGLYPRRRVLDVGSGSGYTTHLLAEMVGDQGLVIGIDHFHELRDLGERSMRASDRGRELLDAGNVVFVSGDGRDGLSGDQRSDIAGVDDNTKWDVIHVGASARWTVPQELMRQLKSPGWWVDP